MSWAENCNGTSVSAQPGGGSPVDAAAAAAAAGVSRKGPRLSPEKAAAGLLGLHEGICDPRTGCLRWPEHRRLFNETTGEVVLGRCKATNLCRYCQMLYVVETVEMLTLDAMEWPPTLYAVLTARQHLTRADCYAHLRQLLRSCRRSWPTMEWFVQVEFQRRGALHLNLLIKGVPDDQEPELERLLGERWCSRVDAEMPYAVKVKPVSAAEGLVRYLQKTLSHGLKAEQAPPIGWKGHRTSQTRGYLVRPAAQMRQEARSALRLKREVWKAINAGYAGHDAELVAHEAIAAKQADSWRLLSLSLKRAPSSPPAAQGGAPPRRGPSTAGLARAS